jgi:hypothetical protein
MQISLSASPRPSSSMFADVRGAFRALTRGLLTIGLSRNLSAVAIAVVAGVAAAVAVGTPLALGAQLAPVSPYGEVSRFGGFAAGSAPANPAKFDVPVGFAVDPGNEPNAEELAESPATKDHNAVYVLDRVTYDGAGHLGYRLQKLSSTGVVLGSVTLPEQTYSELVTGSDAHPMFSLAVDSSKHRVYALVEGLVEGRPGAFVTVAQRLVAWSTEPKAISGKNTLVAAEESPGHPYPEDPLTKAALIAGQSALEPAEPAKDLATPEGIAVDAATHDVVIEAQQGVQELVGGPTILQRVITEGASEGTLGASWVAAAPENEKADGVFTTTTGSFGIDLAREPGDISRLAEVKPGFTEVTPLAEDTSAGRNRDEAPSFDARLTSNQNGIYNISTQGVYTAGSPITQLTNGLYATRYGYYAESAVDSQSNIAPWNGNPPAPLAPFWIQDDPNNGEIANMGVRLFTSSGAVITTIGGQAQGQACNLDDEQMSVAAGANESLFVLTQPNEHNGNSDDQVIEFAPGGAGACPVPSISQVKVTQNQEAEVKGNEGEAIVHQGAAVQFEVSSLNRAGEAPFAFDWNVTGANTGGPNGDGYTLVSQIEAKNKYKWPSPNAEYQYQLEELGLHEASVRLLGAYGTIVFPFKVRVLGSGNPVAQFAVPASITEGQPVVFDGSASKPTPGGSIVEYRWDFSGNGSSVEQESAAPQISHKFAAAGPYNVKLTVVDEIGKEAVAEMGVTVSAASPPACTANCGGTTTGGTTTTSTTHSLAIIPPPPPGGKGGQKPMTDAQKLANALKSCRKNKKKQKRASCEAQARKKYGASSKKKKKKKK